MTAAVTEKAAQGQQEEEGQEQDVPAADDEDHSGEHKAPERKAHRA
jgi:hypothetical protein